MALLGLGSFRIVWCCSLFWCAVFDALFDGSTSRQDWSTSRFDRMSLQCKRLAQRFPSTPWIFCSKESDSAGVNSKMKFCFATSYPRDALTRKHKTSNSLCLLSAAAMTMVLALAIAWCATALNAAQSPAIMPSSTQLSLTNIWAWIWSGRRLSYVQLISKDATKVTTTYERKCPVHQTQHWSSHAAQMPPTHGAIISCLLTNFLLQKFSFLLSQKALFIKPNSRSITMKFPVLQLFH